MALAYGAGLAAGGDQQEARKIVGTSKRDERSSKPSSPQIQDTLRAEVTGDTFCSIGEIIGRGNTPVLSLCRELLSQGVSPDRALAVYRNGQIALRVRSIGAAAKLTVKSGGSGAPIFVRQEGAAASRVENFNGGGL